MIYAPLQLHLTLNLVRSVNQTSKSPRKWSAIMSNVSHSTTSNPAGVARGMADTIRDKGRDVRDTVQQMGSTAKDMAQAGWENARDTAADYLDKGREKAVELGETLEIQIRSRPIRALLIAAGIGFLAGMLLKRS
jgi:ElaB/YqjD/DUF883 family membrane-anchored ribosome-binding protein